MGRFKLLLLALVVALVGCAGPQAPPPAAEGSPPAEQEAAVPAAEPVTITFGAYEYVRATYEPLIEQFNAANPDIQVQFISLDEAMNAGDDSVPWERRLAGVADTFATWGAGAASVEQGFVRDLAPFIAVDAGLAESDFYPGAIERDAQGRVGLLPTTLQLPLFMYNRDLWEARGVARPTADWTWADVRAAAEGLARREGDTIESYGLMLASRADLVGTGALHSLGALTEGQESGAIDLASPPFVAALEEIVAMVRDGVVYTPPEYPDGSFLYSSDYMPLINEGRMGMWRSEHFQQLDGESVDFAVGLAPVPASTRQWQGVSRQGVAMSGGTLHPEQAWRWLAFLSWQDTVESGRGPEAIVARRSLAEASERWTSLDEEERAAVGAALAQLATGGGREEGRRSSAFWQVPNAVGEALTAVLDDGETPEAALAAAQATLDAAVAAAAQLTATPGATPEPIVVATPQPVVAAAPDAARISFVTTEWSNDELRKQASAFNQQFPQYFVTIEQFEWPQGGGGASIGDVVATGDCAQAWGPPVDADRERLLDLRPLLDADQSLAAGDIPAGLLASYEHEGGLLGLPYAVSFRSVQYNQELFDAAGLPYPTAEWTLDEFVGLAEALNTAEGDEGIYGFVPQSGWDLFVYLTLAGVPMVTGAGEGVEPDFATPELAAAIEGYFSLLRAASPAEGISGYARDQPDDNLYQLVDAGRAALWFAYGFNTVHSSGTTEFTRGTAPLPISGGARPTEFFSRGLYISATSASPEACWAWLRFMLDAPTGYGDGFPARSSIAESPAFLDSAPAGAAELYAVVKPALAEEVVGNGMMAVYRANFNLYWLLRAADRAFKGADLGQELADAQFFTEQHLACVRGGEERGACAKQVDPTYDGWE